MRVASRTKTIVFFITLGACLIGVAIALNVSWILLRWREVGALVLGVIFFAFIIAGVVLNTVFLVREIRRNEQHERRQAEPGEEDGEQRPDPEARQEADRDDADSDECGHDPGDLERQLDLRTEGDLMKEQP